MPVRVRPAAPKETKMTNKEAFEHGKKLERQRWAKSLRRWLKENEDYHTLNPCIWIDAILEKITSLAKSKKGDNK